MTARPTNPCSLFFSIETLAILEIGRTSGQTVRRMFIPNWRPQGEEPVGGEEEDGTGTPQPQQQQGKEKQDGGKQDRKMMKSADSKSSKAGKGGQKGKPPSGRKQSTKDEPEVPVVQQENKELLKEDDVLLKRNWYNVVCYGLPNLMVANV